MSLLINNNFSGMILAAGFGKRMKPLTDNLPKPLIDINGLTLLENSINFLNDLGCKQIVINSHYQSHEIKNFLKKYQNKKDITLIYENEILDTAGGVKNAIKYFKNKNLVVINSDIFWQKNNLLDAQILKKKYSLLNKPHILLVRKNNAYGLKNSKGDFNIFKGKIIKFTKGNPILFYSGLQILNVDIFRSFNEKKFSFNDVWDYFIINHSLYGSVMNSDWFHVGDIHGLNIVKKLFT